VWQRPGVNFINDFLERLSYKFWRQKLRSWLLGLKFWRQKFCTKNMRKKRWWNWQLGCKSKLFDRVLNECKSCLTSILREIQSNFDVIWRCHSLPEYRLNPAVNFINILRAVFLGFSDFSGFAQIFITYSLAL